MIRAIIPAALATVVLAGAAQARDEIRVVGSSTVFPFTTTVAESFGATTDFKTPVVESTGTGGGLKLFCAGIGEGTPDIANASRRIKASEVEMCADNGVAEITEVKVGYDGIVIAQSREAAPVAFSLRHLFLALAKNVPADDTGEALIANPYQKWSDIDPDLPNVAIEVLGPPPTSGTRDAFVELAMEGGCKTFSGIAALESENSDRFKAVCHGIREDGKFVEAGENDVLIVQKLIANPDAFGIFGYSFLERNLDRVRGAVIEGSEPTFDNIAEGDYPVSRPLFIYVKNAHANAIPGISEFLAEYTSDRAWGEEGYLSDKGLIPMTEEERDQWHASAANLSPLTM